MARPKKYSPVFPPTVKPVHVGVYQRKAWFGWIFAKWDGINWRSWGYTFNGADTEEELSVNPNLKWRGLAVKS